jgi:hypothetical protein
MRPSSGRNNALVERKNKMKEFGEKMKKERGKIRISLYKM